MKKWGENPLIFPEAYIKLMIPAHSPENTFASCLRLQTMKFAETVESIRVFRSMEKTGFVSF